MKIIRIKILTIVYKAYTSVLWSRSNYQREPKELAIDGYKDVIQTIAVGFKNKNIFLQNITDE